MGSIIYDVHTEGGWGAPEKWAKNVDECGRKKGGGWGLNTLCGHPQKTIKELYQKEY